MKPTDADHSPAPIIVLTAVWSGGQKKHIIFFNISFLATAQNTRSWAPREKMCLISWEGTQKGTHIYIFEGIFGPNWGPKRAIFGHKKFSLLFLSCFYGGLIAPPRSYVPISAPTRASKRRPDQGTTESPKRKPF